MKVGRGLSTREQHGGAPMDVTSATGGAGACGGKLGLGTRIGEKRDMRGFFSLIPPQFPRHATNLGCHVERYADSLYVVTTHVPTHSSSFCEH